VLTADKAVTAARCAVQGKWSIAPSTWVGVLRVGDLQVTIKPKVSISRLIFLLGYARDPIFWRNESVMLDGEPDLAEALAHSFARLARRALEQGVLKGYRTVEESSTVLRGRIREADQIRRHFGRAIPLEITYDDYTVDAAENQILLAAALRLLKAPGLSAEVRAWLHRIRLQLAEVTVLRGGHRPRWQSSRLNARYVPALRLAEQVLRGQSFEHRIGELEVSGFLVNMAKVFEDFVCTALSEATPFGDSRSHLQYSAHLDEAGIVPMKPDFVWERDGVPLVVADAKY
ncbi:MAG: McrC family protein, partial [Rhodococcus sp. (in: high G+C Gram-positive bacteria)]|nr:McrC family protein [Rhodococcus sp. (in: high G+C Gram-positive bacteria)]